MKMSNADVVKVKVEAGLEDAIAKECLIQSTLPEPRELKALTLIEGNILLVFDVVFDESK